MFLFGGPIPFFIKKYKLNEYDEDKEMQDREKVKNKCTRGIEFMEKKLFNYFVVERPEEAQLEKLKVRLSFRRWN
jgi:hypothetical protein